MGAATLVRIALDVRRSTGRLRFGLPVTHVYNPLDYAWEPHRRYLERYGRGRRPVLLVGMNPGPWGMAQTGVPFGDVALVRDWLGISGRVRRPACEHPLRPVRGFDCTRREVSGMRLWGWARETFGDPERFFRSFFIHNWCPLSFMEATGRNRTPDRLRREDRQPLIEICDAALRRVIDSFDPGHIFGIGRFAEHRVREVVGGASIRVGYLLHPSPASPSANRGWEASVRRTLRQAGILR